MVTKTVIKSKLSDYCGTECWYGEIANDFDGTIIRRHVTRDGRLVHAHIIFRNKEQVKMILDSLPDTFQISAEEITHKAYWDRIREKMRNDKQQ